MYRTLTIILLVAVLSGSAAANPPTPQLTPKNPGKATAYSLLGWVTPIAAGNLFAARCGNFDTGPTLLLMAGWVAGPGLGHAYAGNSGKLYTGMAIRGGVLMGAFVLGAAVNNSGSIGSNGEALAAVLVAAGIIWYSAIHDIVTADNSARKYNEEHGLTNVSIAPTYNLTDNTAGLQLTLNF